EMLAARHEMKKRRSNNATNANTEGNEDGTGNVVFVDGHGAVMTRKDALRQKFTGNPVPDPAGF
ncbi:MAG: hypothetical protein NZ561_05925, partial [Phycisphaerae bacterium]|nr:hypothetical protein [Phycisphaerae bacterium]